ncbi:MAG: hypothetical protein K9W44_00390 [Candidatus Lokiarchaeota archaeon]|nr:hypothetical protein [Candidatus Harpocratesius repetitus]
MLDRKLYRIILDALNKEHFYKYPVKFSNRIIVQKTLYLLTHGRTNPKLSLAYKWNFYLRGPYSSEIAHMLYYMNDFSIVLEEGESQDILDEEEINVIKHFKEFKEKIDVLNNGILPEELFEMLATIVYISEQVDYDRSKIEQKFNEFKPELKSKINDEEFKIILNNLSEFGYI